MDEEMTNAGVGVDYDIMDLFKRTAGAAARETANNAERFGFSDVAESRGESAHLLETFSDYLPSVLEGIGTKNLVADAMYGFTGKSHYFRSISQDAVASIVNDVAPSGAFPLSISMFLATASPEWFKDEKRAADLLLGWKEACMQARVVWGGGETQTLQDIIVPGAFVLAGSATGTIRPKRNLIKGDIEHGDAIVILESSGIHANGLTMARKIAEKKDSPAQRMQNLRLQGHHKKHDGYLSKLSDGRTYGDALLDPTPIYSPFIEDCLDQRIRIHYAVNVTGHGLRKFMRLNKPFAYVIEILPKPKPVFEFIQENGPVSDYEMFGNFNMGAGFALYVPESDVKKVLELAATSYLNKFGVIHAGHIEASDEKKVIIKPKNLEYSADTLKIR